MFEDDETSIFGRTDLRKGVSEAKFDVEADFDVEKSLAAPKSTENHEKPKNFVNFFPKKIFGVKKSKVANRPKRVFPKFRGDRSKPSCIFFPRWRYRKLNLNFRSRL